MKKLLLVFLMVPILLYTQSPTKAELKTRFNFYWNGSLNNSYNNYSSVLARVSGDGANQEHYYAAWGFAGALSAWRATGDNTYLNQMITIVETLIGTASYVPIGNGSTYLGWAATRHGDNPKGYPLWESYFWRYVATMLRIMYQSPTLRSTNNGALAGTTYQDNYNTILAFIEQHEWNKWRTDGIGNFYRSNSHMASHWARIGMELHIITGLAKYKEVFDDISFDGMVNYSGANLRENVYSIGSAYSWYSSWNNTYVQDTDHGNDVVDFWVEAVQNGYYWTEADLVGLTNGYKNLIWKSNSPITFSTYVNGSGTAGNKHLPGFMHLARTDTELYNRGIQYFYPTPPGNNQCNWIGTLLLAKAYQEGTVVYPESYTDPPPGDTTPPVILSQTTEQLTETGFKLRWTLDEGSKGWIVFGTTSDTTAPYTYSDETAHENTYPLTHAQGPNYSPNQATSLSPGTTYYYRFYVEDVHGNSGYSSEYSITTLGAGTPVITLTGPSVINLDLGDTYTEQGATWSDGTDSGTATIGGDTVNTSIVGTYTVTYSHTGATSVDRTVIVSNNVLETVKKKRSINFNILLNLIDQ